MLFEEIVEDYQPAIARLCRGYEYDAAIQEELAQEIFLQIWRALPKFRGEASLRTWIYRIAHNVSASHVAKAKRVSVNELTMPDAGEPIDDPERRLEQRSKIRALQRAIRALALTDRQLILLCLEEVPHAEIAFITGQSLTNVSTRIHRIKQVIKSEMEKMANG